MSKSLIDRVVVTKRARRWTAKIDGERYAVAVYSGFPARGWTIERWLWIQRAWQFDCWTSERLIVEDMLREAAVKQYRREAAHERRA